MIRLLAWWIGHPSATGLVRYRGGVVAAWSPAAVCVAVAALAGAAAAAWGALQQGRASARPPPVETADHGEAVAPPRTRPVIEPWMAITAALLIAGIVIAPRLIGVSFLFLPLMFGRRRRWGPGGPRRDDRGRGHDDPGGPGAI
jgi:hypothetical protein